MQMWHTEVISRFNVVLRPLQQSDLETVRQWRNSDPVRLQMLDQSLISTEQQLQWFLKVCQNQTQYQWLIEYKQQPVGACNLKSPDGATIQASNPAETGFYIGEERYRGSILAFFAALALNDYSFNQLKLSRLLAQVKLNNSAAIRFNHQLGYQNDAQHNNMQQMHLTPDGHQQALNRFQRFIRTES